MEDVDRAFLMSRTGQPGGSMEYLINMAHEGNVNNIQPWKPAAPVDTRTFQQYDKNNPTAQKQIGSSAVGVLLPNNPYRAEAEQKVLENVAQAVTDPTAGIVYPFVTYAGKTARGINHTAAAQSLADRIGVSFKTVGRKAERGFVTEDGRVLSRGDAFSHVQETEPGVFRELMRLDDNTYARNQYLAAEEYHAASRNAQQ